MLPTLRILSLAVGLATAFGAPAQAPTPAASAPAATPPAVAPASTTESTFAAATAHGGVLPTLELAADVHLDSLTFGSAPQAHVQLRGGPNLATRKDFHRGTLPDPVKPGATYRNVTLHTTISAKLLDTDAAPAPSTLPPNPTKDLP